MIMFFAAAAAKNATKLVRYFAAESGEIHFTQAGSTNSYSKLPA